MNVDARATVHIFEDIMTNPSQLMAEGDIALPSDPESPNMWILIRGELIDFNIETGGFVRSFDNLAFPPQYWNGIYTNTGQEIDNLPITIRFDPNAEIPIYIGSNENEDPSLIIPFRVGNDVFYITRRIQDDTDVGGTSENVMDESRLITTQLRDPINNDVRFTWTDLMVETIPADRIFLMYG
jgi:hypothetical protein